MPTDSNDKNNSGDNNEHVFSVNEFQVVKYMDVCHKNKVISTVRAIYHQNKRQKLVPMKVRLVKDQLIRMFRTS